MKFDLFYLFPGPQLAGPICVVACSIQVSDSHTKLGWILSNDLGEDSVTDGRTDGGDCNISIALFKKRGDKIAIDPVFVCAIIPLRYFLFLAIFSLFNNNTSKLFISRPREQYGTCEHKL